MGVNWSKGHRSDPSRSEGAPSPHLVGLQRGSGLRSLLGWMPSRMKIRKLPNSSAKISVRQKLTLRNMRYGHQRCSCSTAKAKSVCDWKAICPTTTSSLL